MKYKVDFETYCDLDISKVGAHKYIDHPSCRILCLAIKKGEEVTRVWTPADSETPPGIKDFDNGKDLFYAFNATFDYQVWQKIGVKKHGFAPISLSRVRDAQSLCTRFRMPDDLKRAGVSLGCNTSKMAQGKALIRKCCTPTGNPSLQDFADLNEYCRDDTEVLHEITQRLPADEFLPIEQKLWELTYRMNMRGVPVDKEATLSIIYYLKVYMEQMKEVLPDVTDGFVQTHGQIQKIKDFCRLKGVKLPNLQADTVNTFLEKELPEDVKTVLEIRQILGRSSVTKFITIANMENNGYVQGNLAFHKAGTGRWAGRGFQYHNLPRAKKKDPEKWIQRFIKKEEIEYPVKIAQALIRPMIKAPDGYKLLVGDYSSIENRMLAWLCDDESTLQLFREGRDQYKDMASFLFGVSYDQVSSLQRQIGKQIILGCGYMMGWRRFKEVAREQGVFLSDQQAIEAVIAFRTRYVLVKKMWYAYDDTAKRAVATPGKTFTTHKCSFRVVTDSVRRRWLRITLPSGRAMMYADPSLKDDKFGTVIKYRGMNSKTHQMTDIALTPGLITENIDQGASRDVLGIGMLAVEENMPELKICLSIHDEAGGLIRDEDINDTTIPTFEKHMCTMAPWMTGLPLEMSSYIATRYKKA